MIQALGGEERAARYPVPMMMGARRLTYFVPAVTETRYNMKSATVLFVKGAASKIRQMWFGQQGQASALLSLQQYIEVCSNRRVRFTPEDNIVVGPLALTLNSSEENEAALYSAMTNAAERHLAKVSRPDGPKS